MIGVLRVLRDVAKKDEDYKFVDEERRLKAEKAVEKAVPLILKLQVEVDGKKTAWAAQYYEKTFKPAPARKFEPVSLTAGESVGIIRFLMLDARPSPEKIDAIEAAIAWYRANKIDGLRWERKNGESTIVKDKTAPPVWARFYEIATMRPIFLGRDGAVKYDVMQIEAERRNGYAWYVTEPNELLEKDYPRWKEKINRK
jgi:PelA/Pel-15E family pectate lyase